MQHTVDDARAKYKIKSSKSRMSRENKRIYCSEPTFSRYSKKKHISSFLSFSGILLNILLNLVI